MVAVFARLVSDAELQRAVSAIERRNPIVHEGVESDPEDGKLAEALLGVVRNVIPGPPTKFPFVPNTNHLASPEDWNATRG
jgi:hypothetical protein